MEIHILFKHILNIKKKLSNYTNFIFFLQISKYKHFIKRKINP